MKNKPTIQYPPPEYPGMRLYIGIAVFLLSFIMLPIGLFLTTFVKTYHAKDIVLGIFWISAPLMKITSVAILGKPSYLWIKSRFRHLFHKVVRPYHESKLRYNIGLVMFLLPVIPNYIMAYAPQIITDNFYLRLGINISIDVVFVGSLFVLGGDFWDKLKALFSFSAKVCFEGDSGDSSDSGD
jgi:hypothetical protein